MRVDRQDSVAMLHPMATPDDVLRIARMREGVGVIESPGEPLVMFKSDFLEYSAYSQCVRQAANVRTQVVEPPAWALAPE